MVRHKLASQSMQEVEMAGKLLQFPVGKPELFSREINCEVLRSSEINQVLYAAIHALPHVQNSRLREELKSALCDLLIRQCVNFRSRV
jgi:hypothetical protein